MTVKIGLIGASGRLGKAIADLTPVTPILRTTSRKNLNCDVLIDVSSTEALLENLSAGKPIVIGTTGHVDFSPILEASKHLPIFYAANFSLGIALMHQLAKLAAEKFPSEIDLVETHRSKKKDAPSGTALALAKTVGNARIHSIRTGDVVGEHTIRFQTAEERITISHEAHSRAAFARGAIAAAHFLIGKPAGLYGMDNLLAQELPSYPYARCQN